ncbi:histidine phosphatase family protein [Amycolatopsis sp. OK19-0408]|uniref:Histidine phosphatase family protein n=1 Tax=Amycolatopsis iheyensis TaxID=2945988 RepID=A0A9X2N6I0_9PSEU|nr:histidine phosphatase family protein [Amycolatopsis iheyensis]MCR6481697.1 histidine phosphatase family protein [Amycolatopsis iheyensis]
MRWVYVVAHPEATHHVERRVGGWFDSALTTRGRVDAQAIAERLRELIPPAARVELYSSDLRRTVETASPIASVFGVDAVLLPELREKSYGIAGGLPQSWLDERFVPPPATGERLDHDEGIEGAETKLEWVTRVYRGMDRVRAGTAEHQVIVTHGGSLSWVVAAWLGLPVAACAHAAFRSSAGGITVLGEDDRFHNRTLHTLNDVDHLVTTPLPWVSGYSRGRPDSGSGG